MMFLYTFLISSLAVFVFVSVAYAISIYVGRNSIADVAWGLGFILISYIALFINGVQDARQILVTLLVLLWGVRLSVHIYLRNRGVGEDFRYADWKAKWGKRWALKSYLYVFLLQGAFMLLVSLPVSFTNSTTGPTIGALDQIGAFVWIIGFYFETVGDLQLFKFRKDPNNKGKILNKGLWKYTRHPNYFGEATMWWGIYIIALSNFDAWWTFIGPLFITFSLLKVSGVSLLEKHYKGNKEYQEYQRKTSSFLPWWPQK